MRLHFPNTQQNPVLRCQRLAAREHRREPYAWISPVIHYTARDLWRLPRPYADDVLAALLCEASQDYSLEDILVIEAPSPEAYDALDLSQFA